DGRSRGYPHCLHRGHHTTPQKQRSHPKFARRLTPEAHDALAFPSVHWALNHDREAQEGAPPVPFANPGGAIGDTMPDGRPLPIGEF
ncbi:hypothetical protein VQ042_15755, partial [Aurantimonas sp. A2-1-M11]